MSLSWRTRRSGEESSFRDPFSEAGYHSVAETSGIYSYDLESTSRWRIYQRYYTEGISSSFDWILLHPQGPTYVVDGRCNQSRQSHATVVSPKKICYG